MCESHRAPFAEEDNGLLAFALEVGRKPKAGQNISVRQPSTRECGVTWRLCCAEFRTPGKEGALTLDVWTYKFDAVRVSNTDIHRKP